MPGPAFLIYTPTGEGFGVVLRQNPNGICTAKMQSGAILSLPLQLVKAAAQSLQANSVEAHDDM